VDHLGKCNACRARTDYEGCSSYGYQARRLLTALRYGAIQIKRIRTFGQPMGRMLVVSDKTGQGESVSMDEYAVVGFMVGKMTLD